MTTAEIFTAASALLAIGAAWFIALWLYRPFRVDLFRQRMFALRDEVFDLARHGTVGFNDPAYNLLRTMCNGYLRFGHRLSFTSVILLSWTLKSSDKKWLRTRGFSQEWRAAMRLLDDPEARRQLEALKTRAERLVVNHLVFGSPLLVVSVVPVVVFTILFRFPLTMARGMRRWLRKTRDRVDGTAYALGEIG